MSAIYEAVNNIASFINANVISYALIVVLLAGGFYFTFRTKFAQFRLFKEQLRSLKDKPDEGGVSSFQALMVSTASRVGTGNIVAVATAICLGGFGSVFWMWVIAIIGAASALIESTLAQIYKRKGADGCYGGPSYYIETGLKSKGLALTFSILLIITYGLGFNMLAAYNLLDTFTGYEFYKNNTQLFSWGIGIILAGLVGYCLIGGGKRIAKITGVLVPVMGVFYVLVALVIVVLNAKTLPYVFTQIFKGAFDLKAIFGGFTGSCLMYGIKRGLFSNEAGVGSAPNASATAEVSHPVKQGLVQVLSVFIDTILICSATAFMCMCSGITPEASIAGAQYVQQSVATVLGDFGPIFITVAMVLFAFTTLIGNLYYVDQCIFFILKKVPGKLFKNIYYILASLIILLGTRLDAGLLWNIAEITMGAMTLINIPTIFYLSKYAVRAIDDYDKQRKDGKIPVFKAESIGLPHKVDYWH